MRFQERGERLDNWLWSLRWDSWLTPILNWIRPPKPVKPMDPVMARLWKREAERLLSQKVHFVNNINRTYDQSFANSRAKIGDSLNIRRPPRYRIPEAGQP